jgi:hypothetical protein
LIWVAIPIGGRIRRRRSTGAALAFEIEDFPMSVASTNLMIAGSPQAAARENSIAAVNYSLRQLVTYFLAMGTWGFGGPVALVGYMHRDLVERRKWITEFGAPSRPAVPRGPEPEKKSSTTARRRICSVTSRPGVNLLPEKRAEVICF